MPMTIKSVNERRETFELTWGQESAQITYSAGKADQIAQDELDEWQAKAKELESSGDNNAAKAFIAEIVCRFVTVWDVLQDDGTMLPLDVEHVMLLDWRFNLSVVVGLLEDVRAKKEPGTPSHAASGATSSPAPEATA